MSKNKKNVCTMSEAMNVVENYHRAVFNLLTIETTIKIVAMRPSSTKESVMNHVLDAIETFKAETSRNAEAM